jgi:hypothetical protein
MYASLAQHGSPRQRTAPYLSAACLALLALAGAQTFADGSARPGARPVFALPPAAWLAGPAPSHALALFGAAAAFAAPGVTLAQRAGEGPLFAAGPTRQAEMLRLPTPRLPVTPLARGALSTPALLLAVALALCH